MSTWRPLSKRGQADPRLDEPTEGLPPYLAGPMTGWLQEVFRDRRGGVLRSQLQDLQLAFKLEQPLDWQTSGSPLRDLLSRVVGDEEFGLNVIDYVLQHLPEFCERYEHPSDYAATALGILVVGGSAWEVTRLENATRFQLSRRAVGPVREAIESVPSSTRAHQHLVLAWNKLSGRNPDASGAYREAIRAVEAAAKPVVLPNDASATLGKMKAALRDKPGTWTTTIGAVDDVRRLIESVWTSQLDRHGTDDESVPLTVSLEQADAAFSICLNLTRLFVGGHVSRVAA